MGPRSAFPIERDRPRSGHTLRSDWRLRKGGKRTCGSAAPAICPISGADIEQAPQSFPIYGIGPVGVNYGLVEIWLHDFGYLRYKPRFSAKW